MPSCKSFLDVDLPKSQLTNQTVFDNYETASAALTEIYSKIRSSGILAGTAYGISNNLGNYTDELISYGTPSSNSSVNFYNNSLLATNSFVALYWSTAYNQIYGANAVIEGVEASKGITAERKKQLQGEAFFIRALLHFYLVNLFGDIPYVVQTDYLTNKVMTRMPTAEVYTHIITDLKMAIDFLPAQYIGNHKIRPNQSVAKALLSRTYLYNQSWSEAEAMATSLINQTNLFSFEDDLNGVFLIGSKETIWQLHPANAGQNTEEGAIFIFIAGPPAMISLNPNLVNSFSSNDLRRSSWINAVTDGTSIWYHAFKYKEREATSVSKEYSILFRLTEQYLIRAEARAQQEDLQGAREDLNKIRHRAELSDTPATTKDEMLGAILEERKWELFTEQGHRFFDLKRFEKLDQVLSGIKPGWNSNDRLFPIPQTEISTNPNLRPQNTGY